MWFYRPVFIDGIGQHYLQWREKMTSEENKARLRNFLADLKTLAGQGKKMASAGVKIWREKVWPMIENLFKKQSD
jgi:hypothetical protein